MGCGETTTRAEGVDKADFGDGFGTSLATVETYFETHWAQVVAPDGEWPGTIIVDGVDAGPVARTIVAAGGPALVNDADPLAVLTGPGFTDDPDHLSEVPSDFADMVILRWSWDSIDGMAEAFAQAARILHPGGRMLAMEPDDEVLMAASPNRYPFRLLLDAAPDLLELRGHRTAGRARMVASLIRARFVEDLLYEVEEPRGEYPGAAELWEAAMAGAWPVLDLLGDQRVPVMEQVADDLARVVFGPVVDKRPWLVATGLRR